MNEIDLLRRYGDESAETGRVNIDVTARVMRTLHNQRDEYSAAAWRPFAAVAAAAWVAVLATGISVYEAWNTLQDPIVSLLSPFVLSMQ
jgi:hypothetical protein